MRARVVISTLGAGRGPGGVSVVIEDAIDVGHSEYANDAGECFWTMPWNHSAHGQVLPLRTWAHIQRQANQQSPWKTVGYHLVSDHDSTDEDTVYYGDDPLSLFRGSLTDLKTKYTTKPASEIIQTEAERAISQWPPGYTSQDPNSRLGFMTIGTIDATADTLTTFSDYQSRLDFMVARINELRAGGPTRPTMLISRNPPFTFNFYKNLGVDRPEIHLEYGGLVNSFRLRGGYGALASEIRAVAQTLTGSSVLFSDQVGTTPALYGIIQKAAIYPVIANQIALDRMTLNDARQSSQLNRDLALVIRSDALGPYDGYQIMDSFPVTIKRGKVNLDHAWYTLWGLEWIGHKDGSEQVSMVLLPKMT
jgi:hypothetical protein